jgi:hypothetical protein
MASNAPSIHELESSELDSSKHYSNLTLSTPKGCEELDSKGESRACGSSLNTSRDITRSLQIRTTSMKELSDSKSRIH